jgi:glycosyltransferase involved in cell wall biosynthesis
VGESGQKGLIGYIVSAWPRLSETFILNEVMGLERLGIALRIYSLKDPGPGLVHTKVGEVWARVICLADARHWRSAVRPSLRLLTKHPVRYFRTLLQAVRFRHSAGRRRFYQAVCLADRLAREPVAHLHAHFANAPALVAMFVHELTGLPYTFTAHAKDIYVKTPPELLRAEIERAQAVVTCTEYNRRFLCEQFGPRCRAKLHRIYHGLDLSEFPLRAPRPGSEEAPLILSVARLVEKKGLRDLLAASDLLRRRGRCFRVEIIGDGPLQAALESQAAELQLQDWVRLLGAQSHEMVRRAYARASVFALPCVVAEDGDRDGIPNVLLEAMASGVPVVSTPVSGIPEVIESEREGLLVPPHNPEELAGALERLLSDAALCQRLTHAARGKIEGSFAVEQNCRRLLEVFGQARPEVEGAPGLEQVTPASSYEYRL